MPADQQIPTAMWLLIAGGQFLLGVGFFIALIGIYFVIRSQRRKPVLVLTWVSLIPILLASVTVYFSAAEFATIAASHTPPKPAVFGALVSRAFSNAFCGLLGSLLAILPSLVALGRVREGSQPEAA